MEQFKYLRFTFNKERNYKNHIKKKKKGIIAKKTLGLRKRKCKNDFNRRKKLFNYLIKSVLAYGSEIWGLEEKKKMRENTIGLF